MSAGQSPISWPDAQELTHGQWLFDLFFPSRALICVLCFFFLSFPFLGSLRGVGDFIIKGGHFGFMCGGCYRGKKVYIFGC